MHGAALQRHRSAVRARLAQSGLQRGGSGSITWAINREILVVAGWGRAILLQLAHPAVAAGVRDHSSFRGSLSSGLGRLRSTVGAMQAIAFGSDDEMVEAAARINAIHDRVRGRLRDDAGDTYSAHDPELQRWVHATLLESIPAVYEMLIGPLTDRERDRYCAEAAIMEPLLGMPAGLLPRDAAALDAYVDGMRGRLAVTDTTRALARAVLYPPLWQVAWPFFRPMQLLTIGTLPAAVRDAYGFAWGPREVRALARWTSLIRMFRSMLPRIAREWPVARRRHVSTSPSASSREAFQRSL